MVASTSTRYAELWGDRWFKTAEAIRIAAIGRTRLFALLREGKIRARKHGGTNLIEGRSLGEFIDGLPEWRPGAGMVTPKSAGS
jgi:hypothetical protein